MIGVTDTGTGISPDNIIKLFNPFERMGAEKTEIEGTGLGLVVVKKLVDAMGGIVLVESGLGKGSTFRVELPMAVNHVLPVQPVNLTEHKTKTAKKGVQFCILKIIVQMGNWWNISCWNTGHPYG